MGLLRVGMEMDGVVEGRYDVGDEGDYGGF